MSNNDYLKIALRIDKLEARTDSGYLFSMPSKSKYKDFMFWFGFKSSEEVYKDDKIYSLYFNEKAEFYLIRYKKLWYGYSNVILETKVLKLTEFLEEFNGYNKDVLDYDYSLCSARRDLFVIDEKKHEDFIWEKEGLTKYASELFESKKINSKVIWQVGTDSYVKYIFYKYKNYVYALEVDGTTFTISSFAKRQEPYREEIWHLLEYPVTDFNGRFDNFFKKLKSAHKIFIQLLRKNKDFKPLNSSLEVTVKWYDGILEYKKNETGRY